MLCKCNHVCLCCCGTWQRMEKHEFDRKEMTEGYINEQIIGKHTYGLNENIYTKPSRDCSKKMSL